MTLRSGGKSRRKVEENQRSEASQRTTEDAWGREREPGGAERLQSGGWRAERVSSRRECRKEVKKDVQAQMEARSGVMGYKKGTTKR